MSVDDIIGLVLAATLLCYLVAALVFPERM